MGRTKKTSYTESEKKGLSQARNLGTDRLLGKIKEHADVTDHKVFVNFLPTWDKGVSRVWVSDNWGDTAPLRHDGRGNLEAANGGFPTLENPPRPHRTATDDSEAELPGSQTLQLKPPASSSGKKDKQKMKTVCEKCFTAKSTKDDLFPGVPWLRCGVSGCMKLNIHSSCGYIKLASVDAKSVTNFCRTFIRCQSHLGEIVDSYSETESDSEFQLQKPKAVKRSKPKARAVKTPGSFLLENDDMFGTNISEEDLNDGTEFEVINMSNMEKSSNDPWENFNTGLGQYTPVVKDTNVTAKSIKSLKTNIFSVPRKDKSAQQFILAGSEGDKNTSGPGQWSTSGHGQSTSSGHGLNRQTDKQWPTPVQRLATSFGQRLDSCSGQEKGQVRKGTSQRKGTSGGQEKRPKSGQEKRPNTAQEKRPKSGQEKRPKSGQEKRPNSDQRYGTSAGQNHGTSLGEGNVTGSGPGHKLKPVSSVRDDGQSVPALEGRLVEEEDGARAVLPGPSAGQAGSVQTEKRKVKPMVLKLTKKPKLID